jgi:hypothetical protein
VQLFIHCPVEAALSLQEVIPEQNAMVVAPQAQLLSQLFKQIVMQLPVAVETSLQT